MTEKNLIVNAKEFTYSGIFKADDIFRTVNRAIEEKGYSKREKKTEELVTEYGKATIVELRPFKFKANYMKLEIRVKIILDNVTETVQEIDGKKHKFQHGDVRFIFDAWLITDYEYRWTQQPWVYFMKAMINKYLYKFPLEPGFQSEVGDDTAFIYAQLKALLNSYTPKESVVVDEKAIQEQIQEEIEAEIAQENS